MTFKDRQNIKELFHVHRYNKSAIGRLYGLTRVRIGAIINENSQEFFGTDEECLLCGNDDANVYYIDGNEDNQNPQNKINLCEMDKRRIEHLQLNKRVAEAKSQS